jgi:hypothetical protein
MTGNINHSLDNMLVIICIFIAFTFFFMQNREIAYKQHNMELNKILNENEKQLLLYDEKINELNDRILLKKRDEMILYDNFKAPERRVPAHQYPNAIKNVINIPTRGLPDNYQLIGVASRNNTETVFNLFGRQKFPGSNQYEYYVQSTNMGNQYKIPIAIKGDKEIEDNMHIHIDTTDHTKGPFTVKLYSYDAPRYNPYI